MRFAVLLFVPLIGACSSVGGSAIRTGPLNMPAYSGPVAIYSNGQPPPGAADLGVVEVHAVQEEGTVETLLPKFVQKVASIGGNVAVIDGVRARFEVVGRNHVETFYYTCGMGATCGGTRVYSANDELMIVTILGRAMTTNVKPAETPLLVPEPVTPPEDSPLVPVPQQEETAP